MKIPDNYFEVKAAMFYLAEDYTKVEESFSILEKECEKNPEDYAKEYVEVWEPFENYSMVNLLECIYTLANTLKDVYQEGYKDGELDVINNLG